MDSLQFPCPACDKRLRVPSSAAGQRGPCPNCGEEIIGPQPALGIPARISLQVGPPLNEIPLPPTPRPVGPQPRETKTVSEALEAFQPKEVVPEVHKPSSPSEDPSPVEPPPTESVNAPAASTPSDDGPTRRIRQLWAAVFILSCVLCTVLAFIGGYLTALKRTEVAAPIFAVPRVEPPPIILPSELPPLPAPDVESDDASDEPPIDEASTTQDDPPAPATLDSRATLEAFLSASDWATRSAYVAEEAHPAMKAAAEEEGDGPIEVTSIEPSLLDGDLHHYHVTTDRLPKGFPVTLRETPTGWQVDWSSFHEFSTDGFGRFLAGELGDAGQFRVFLKPVEDSQPAFAAYQLTSPTGGPGTLAYASRSSQAHASLTALLDSEELGSNPRYQDLLESSGLPMTLELARKTSSDGQTYTEITGLVAASWNRG